MEHAPVHGTRLAWLKFDDHLQPSLANFHLHPLVTLALFLCLILLWMRVRGFPFAALGNRLKSALRARWKPFAKGAALFILAIILAGAAWQAKTEFQARSIQKAALARWAEIGRPMPEFEKKFIQVEENTSIKELLTELKPFGIVTLYKSEWNSTLTADPNTFRLPTEALDILSQMIDTAGDQATRPSPELAYAKQHTDDLNRLYQGLVRREPPVWALDFPNTGFPKTADLSVLRLLSQLIAADATCRIASGDLAGAALAIEAGLKLSQHLEEQSMLVCYMFRVAITGLFTRQTARLPEDPKAWERLEKEVAAVSEQLLKVLQGEACWLTRIVDSEGAKCVGFNADWCHPFPQWIGKIYAPAFVRLEAAKNSAFLAEQAQMQQQISKAAHAVIEKQRVVATTECNNVFTPCFARSVDRMNLTLLLREQAEMIRFARARVREGKTQAEHPSVVFPGSKWRMTGDLDTNSASLKLEPIPSWVINNSVADDKFFLLPLDGSKSWKFAPVPDAK